MGTTGNNFTKIEKVHAEYCDAWAKMMVTIWQDKIIKLNVRDTGELLKSFMLSVVPQSGGDINKIQFSYLYYGRMVDMGVGRGVTQGNFADTGLKRKSKGWYNKSFYHSVKVLSEKRAALYGEEFQAIIMDTLNF